MKTQNDILFGTDGVRGMSEVRVCDVVFVHDNATAIPK